ncbi:MAG: GNAT family N-acetyltransferase [Sphingobacteriales bacterium]|nr:GNAT family N-acetyltransferase [Sphingobacteriales bacterium]MBI3717084.1 GNAT family N-acetyltransferase [Sphingobacteriales bacterium]
MTNWVLKKFDELTPHELYAILQLRNEVFVVEQNCVFQDADDKDQHCWHYMGWRDNYLAAYIRIVPPGVAYEYPSIGRVVSSPKARGSGIGRELMANGITVTHQLFGEGPIKIGAQLYLKKFYELLGFEQVGEIYDEDGIDHIYMIRP